MTAKVLCKCGNLLERGADTFHPDDYAGKGGCWWNTIDSEGNCDHEGITKKSDIIFSESWHH